jgi:hypothetical protein
MDEAMRARFVRALEAKGIHKGNWAKSSIEVIGPKGKPLDKTYLRNAILRKKGKDEYVQLICAHFEISWEYVKFNKGPATPLLLIEGPRPSSEEAERGLVTIDPLKLIDVVEGVCRMCGASPKRAARLAREVLISVQGRELSD